ncbi:hypothetical protein, partial [Bacteroides stercoris]|uniref:hypothetical protein n=1 Tax=Bacteroides stercoris TaxID=46506 RepID=UPI001C7044B7
LLQMLQQKPILLLFSFCFSFMIIYKLISASIISAVKQIACYIQFLVISLPRPPFFSGLWNGWNSLLQQTFKSVPFSVI